MRISHNPLYSVGRIQNHKFGGLSKEDQEKLEKFKNDLDHKAALKENAERDAGKKPGPSNTGGRA